MDDNKKLYLGNLNFDLKEEELRQALEAKGVTPKAVSIIMNKFSGKSKGFGFAEFETESEAQAAIEALDGQDVAGRPLRVNKARKLEPRPPRYAGARSNDSY